MTNAKSPAAELSAQPVTTNQENLTAPAPWWRGAAIYQIYPRSFLDADGDGVGDLRGCMNGLDHIASLGVDAIWLSPFFKSPMCDFGYDVSDYLDVDPLFGSLRDFDELVCKAHNLNLKVLIDQVYSHTSDKHLWFEESRLDHTNEKANWYVWADPKPDGSPPNNWQSVFGGPAWEWDARRRQYYLHNFLPSQPDLNLHHPDVQAALLDVARYWLERGVDGFRLDAINFAMHDPELRDNPPARMFMRPPTRPFEFQEHRYNQSHSDIVKFLERIRAVTDSFGGAFTVAEIGGYDSFGEMKAFTKGDQRLNSAYSFEYLYADRLTSDLIRRANQKWADGEGWPSWAFSNHDAPRAISRWAKGVPASRYAKFVGLLLVSLRGNIFIYQGEELGLEQADVPFEKLQDPEAIKNWPATLGRDGARTPIPWRTDAPHAGFSTAEPWLPIDARHLDCAVSLQENDPTSMLNFMRRILKLRSENAALRYGDFAFLPTPEHITAFVRTDGDEQFLCVFNMSETTQNFIAPDKDRWTIVANANISDGVAKTNGAIPEVLNAASGYIAKRR